MGTLRLLGSRVLAVRRATITGDEWVTLEGVLKSLEAIASRQKAVDYVVEGPSLRVARGQVLSLNLRNEVLPLTLTAFAQLGQLTLPAGFLRGWKVLYRLDPVLAAQVWNTFLSHSDRRNRRSLMVRTVLRRMGKKVIRVVRSVHSAVYAPVSHVELLQMARQELPDLAAKPILEFRLEDDFLYVYWLAMEKAVAALAPYDRGLLAEPLFPAIQLSNSETGKRAVRIQAGVYKLFLAEGESFFFSAQTLQGSWRRVHKGRRVNLLADGAGKMGELSRAAADLAAWYEQAAEAEVGSVPAGMAFVQQRWKDAPQVVLDLVRQRLDKAAAASGENTLSLRDCVDALLYVAAKKPYVAEEVQRVLSAIKKEDQDKEDSK